jgi:hypothetical protein
MAPKQPKSDKEPQPQHQAENVPESFEQMGDRNNQGVFDEPTVPRDQQGKVPGKRG